MQWYQYQHLPACPLASDAVSSTSATTTTRTAPPAHLYLKRTQVSARSPARVREAPARSGSHVAPPPRLFLGRSLILLGVTSTRCISKKRTSSPVVHSREILAIRVAHGSPCVTDNGHHVDDNAVIPLIQGSHVFPFEALRPRNIAPNSRSQSLFAPIPTPTLMQKGYMEIHLKSKPLF